MTKLIVRHSHGWNKFQHEAFETCFKYWVGVWSAPDGSYTVWWH